MHTFIITCVYRTHAISSVTAQMRIRAHFYGFELIKTQIKWIIIIPKIKWYECHASTLSSYPLIPFTFHRFLLLRFALLIYISFYLFIAILNAKSSSLFFHFLLFNFTRWNDYTLHCADGAVIKRQMWICEMCLRECECAKHHNNQIGAEQNRNCAFGLSFV